METGKNFLYNWPFSPSLIDKLFINIPETQFNMKSIVFYIPFLISAVIHAQTKNTIVMGNIDSVYSNILKENRKIWVHVPDDYSPDGIFAKQRYPVVYLLDGDDMNFSSVVSIVQQLGGGSGNTMFPQMIVAGIVNTDRTRDLTPTHVSAAPMLDSMSAAHSGGGENFISFIQQELIPHIDSLYPTAPYRLLIGHSFGGLMVIHALINHNNLFNSYVAIDPSMFWDNQKLLKQTKTGLEKNKFEGRSLFLAVANTMDKGMDTVYVKKDTNIMSLHIRSILELGKYLNANKQNELKFGWKYYPDYDHGSVPLIAEYDALRFIFKFYNFNFPFSKFFNPSYKSDTLISAHYRNVSWQMGYKVSPPEQLINGLAYQLMGLKQFDRAFNFFKMNIENYPESFNAYDSMGDFYDAKGDKQKALEYFSKALALRDFPDTGKKPEKLKQRQ
jgi:predicted alpha/beta superfamily hydrolase